MPNNRGPIKVSPPALRRLQRLNSNTVGLVDWDDVINKDQFNASDSGIVPASGGGFTNFLRADGVWGPPVTMETTWTPRLRFGGAGTGMTFTTQSGWYLQVGRTIIATFHIVLSAKGSSTGSATIDQLPASVNFSAFSSGAIDNYQNMSGINFMMTVSPLSSTTTAQLRDGGITGMNNLTDTHFTNTSEIEGMIVYRTT